MQNIILCGGSGTRLWPVSRTSSPKQFLKLFDDKSLFQLTVNRNKNKCSKSIIVSNKEQLVLAGNQIAEFNIKNSSFIIEPIGRNTAPAIALACLSVDPDEIVLVTPSDHLIKNQKSYEEVLNKAEKFAQAGNLVTFGITPDRPETGFGYLETEGNTVLNFHEKPELSKAKNYLKAGNYYWNSGMFCFKAGIFLSELQKFNPDIFSYAKKAYDNAKQGQTINIDYNDMLKIPKDSIDYAVMEKSNLVKVVPADISWSDVGSFDALYNELPKDTDGNTKTEKLININCKNNLIVNADKRTIALIDLEDIVVVDTQDALLIAKRGSSQKVKDIVEEVKLKNDELTKNHLTTIRPWGSYTILHDTSFYKTKRIDVLPGKRLSLQSHKKRDELWQIVAGTGKVTLDDKEIVLSYGEKVEIKREQKHRIENIGNKILTFIEIQTGEYFGEDDIFRYQDDFDRA